MFYFVANLPLVGAMCVATRLTLAWLGAALVAGIVEAADSSRVLDSRRYHLGTSGAPEWQEFAGQTPYARRLDLNFSAPANPGEATLFIRQDDVKLEWGVELNHRKLGKLFLIEAPLLRSEEHT